MFDVPAAGHLRAVTASYRLQLHGGFTFDDAARQVPYLAELGVTTLYLSPVLQAVAGSQHGYDVVDHDRVSDELGGEDRLRALSSAAHDHGLSVLVDVVPNHVAFDPDCAPLWELLAEGPTAPRAHWFDVDWRDGEGRVTLPILGGDLETEIAERVVSRGSHRGRPVLRYHDHVLPLAAGTGHADLATVLDRQHYRLVGWQESADRLNYRRFFAVSSLVAVRVELPDVFEATHRLLLDLHHDGVIDGFRVDHPDGLADPEDYLRTLRSRLRPGTPVYVEKILQGDERLPMHWPVEGTTGYEAIRSISHALAPADTLPVLDSTWAKTGGPTDLAEVVDEAKRYVVEDVLAAETARLVRRAAEALHVRAEDVRAAVVELLVSGRVYRAYHDCAPAAASPYRRTVLEAVARAELQRPDLSEMLRSLAGLVTDPTGDAGRDFSVRLQQVWGAVVAKSVEDTAFYRWHRLVALNEVGGEPGELEPVEALHTWAAHRQTAWPLGMTPLSTHDTKRSEDVRARLLAVAADPEAWQQCSDAFGDAADELGVDRPTAHFVWQTMVGAGDVERDRLHAALTKSVREASQHTSWTAPDDAYERRVLDLADLARSPGRLQEALTAAEREGADAVRAVVLGQKALQLLLPGIPDLYQGTELVDLSLVDPDNRRPVDYQRRRALLEALREREPADLDEEKLFVTTSLLRLRQELPEAFGPRGRYAPVPGPFLGFVRGDRVACLARGAQPDASWRDERVHLPDGIWRDRLTGHVVSCLPTVVDAPQLFDRYPVAVLVRDP